ncbi:MAG: CpsD/CapB family tyrosine-protein kinase [Acutalibacteraceae bacterium]|jgi:capsular exopolysaccharide synthesis family protein
MFKKLKSKQPIAESQTNNPDNSVETQNKHKKGYYQTYDNVRLIGKNMPNKVPFAVVEAYKNIRIHLMSILSETGGKIIAFSSPNISEGKSTTSVNIAITISQLNKKVILLDSDVRRPTINKKLNLENEKGCTDVLAGTATLEEAVQKYSDNLDVLTSGTVSENPSELYSSAAFDRLLDELSQKYDYIIIDTPPVNIVSDSLAVAQKCDGLVLIVRAGVTTFASFKNSLSHIKQLNIKLLGTVINGSGAEKRKYYKYYRKNYYNYGYK